MTNLLIGAALVACFFAVVVLDGIVRRLEKRLDDHMGEAHGMNYCGTVREKATGLYWRRITDGIYCYRDKQGLLAKDSEPVVLLVHEGRFHTFMPDEYAELFEELK